MTDERRTNTRFTDESWAPIAVAERSGFDESLDHGAGVIVGPDGSVRAVIGDPELLVYARSALKPLQAMAMVEGGLDLPPDLVAVVAASHSGEPVHLAAVRRILDLHGLDETDLRNTPALPYGAVAREEAERSGRVATSIQQNCSGKHAGMLATCRVNGWDLSRYLDESHPLQMAITASVEARGASAAHIGVDGCGAPAHVIRLVDLARAVGEMTRGRTDVARSMSAHPHLVGGTDRDVTIWMEALPGLVAKEGAAGVMVLALPDGSAAAFKIAGGVDEARQAVTVQALRHLGVDVDGEYRSVAEAVAVPVRGQGRAVGLLRPLPWSSR